MEGAEGEMLMVQVGELTMSGLEGKEILQQAGEPGREGLETGATGWWERGG